MLGGVFHHHSWRMRYLSLFLLLIRFLASAEIVHEGRVIKIADGDTLAIRTGLRNKFTLA